MRKTAVVVGESKRPEGPWEENYSKRYGYEVNTRKGVCKQHPQRVAVLLPEVVQLGQWGKTPEVLSLLSFVAGGRPDLPWNQWGNWACTRASKRVEILDLEGICLNRAEILGEKVEKRITEEGPWKMKAGEKVGQCSQVDSQQQLEWKNHLTKKPRSKEVCSKLVDGDHAEERSGEWEQLHKRGSKGGSSDSRAAPSRELAGSREFRYRLC